MTLMALPMATLAAITARGLLLLVLPSPIFYYLARVATGDSGADCSVQQCQGGYRGAVGFVAALGEQRRGTPGALSRRRRGTTTTTMTASTTMTIP